MRVLGFILAACVGLAALRVAFAVALVLYLALLIVAMLTKPAETLCWLGFWLVCFLLTEHTIATLAAFCVLMLACAIAKRRES